jgi:hypothetical protein
MSNRQSQVGNRVSNGVYSLRMVGDSGFKWTFLTNHAHVLLCIRRDDEIRLRDVATLVGITERAAQKIVSDLAEAVYLRVDRVGRRNRYRVQARRPLRHPLERGHSVGELLDLLEGDAFPRRQRPASR